jgi:hypothetical protein
MPSVVVAVAEPAPTSYFVPPLPLVVEPAVPDVAAVPPLAVAESVPAAVAESVALAEAVTLAEENGSPLESPPQAPAARSAAIKGVEVKARRRLM